MTGAMLEIGPYRMAKGGHMELNGGSWNQIANLLFVDNPVGTGFSHVDEDGLLHELSDMAEQFIIFMTHWFQLFPAYEHNEVRSLEYM